MPPIIPRSPLSPQCISCCQRLVFLGSGCATTFGPQTQIRGKKKNAKARTHLNIRLVKDLEGHGLKGNIIPVPIGLMRNYYFPQHLAEYVSEAETREHRRNKIVFQRDYEFGTRKELEKKSKVAQTKRVPVRLVQQPTGETQLPDHVRVELDLWEPQAAFKALSQTIPSFISFYRAPISSTEASPARNPAGTNIYGSVSTTDISTNLKALLANSDLAGKIVLSESDIHFTRVSSQGEQEEQHDEADRVKQLGNYDIEIKIKGHTESIRRQVRVLPEDAMSSTEEDGMRNDIETESAAEYLIIGDDTTSGIESLEEQLKDLEMLNEDVKGKSNVSPSIEGATVLTPESKDESSSGARHER